MKQSIIESTREFKKIYKNQVRQSYDIGEIKTKDIVFNDKLLSDLDYFFNNLNDNREIHIGQPFNLILDIKKNEYFKQGWRDLKNINQFLFFGNQNEIFFAQSLEDLKIFSMVSGDSEVYYIAKTFNDFLAYINAVLKISLNFLKINNHNEDYYILEDEDFIKEVKNFTNETNLQIEKENIFDMFFL